MSPMSFGKLGARRPRQACDEGVDPFASRKLAQYRLVAGDLPCARPPGRSGPPQGLPGGDSRRPPATSGRRMMGRAAPLPRAWRIYAVSNFISQIGTWMQATAQAWLVLELTGSPELLGLLVAIQYFPAVLLAIPAGKVADRWGRRNLLLSGQAAMAILAGGLAAIVAAGNATYPVLAGFALLLGVGNALSQPARIAMAATLAGGEGAGAHGRVRAAGMATLSFNLARILGPALAGFAIAAYGPTFAFAVNADFLLTYYEPILFSSLSVLSCIAFTDGSRTAKSIAIGHRREQRAPAACRVPCCILVRSTTASATLGVGSSSLRQAPTSPQLALFPADGPCRPRPTYGVRFGSPDALQRPRQWGAASGCHLYGNSSSIFSLRRACPFARRHALAAHSADPGVLSADDPGSEWRLHRQWFEQARWAISSARISLRQECALSLPR